MIDRNRSFKIGCAIALVAICAPKNVDQNASLCRPSEFVLQLCKCIFSQECRVHDEPRTGLPQNLDQSIAMVSTAQDNVIRPDRRCWNDASAHLLVRRPPQ